MSELKMPFFKDDFIVMMDFGKNEIEIQQKKGNKYDIVEVINIFDENEIVSHGNIYFKRVQNGTTKILNKKGEEVFIGYAARELFSIIEKVYMHPKAKPEPSNLVSKAFEEESKRAATNSEYERYECTTEGHNKFWEAKIEGNTLCRRWGRIGSLGESQRDSYGNASVAEREMDKLIREKMRKGYIKVH